MTSTNSKATQNIDWTVTSGDEGVTRYSEADQISKENVARLKPVWTYHSGNTKGNVQCNPLIINGVMYVTTPAHEVVAVNAATGQEIWKYNPARPNEKMGGINRGLAFWREGENLRILYTANNYLYAIDARTGKTAETFGEKGRVDLNEGLVRPASDMKITSPASPVIYKDIVIVGSMSWSAPANVSGFDIRTGKKLWTFHTIPKPSEYGHDTWDDPNFWKTGAGVNVWGGLSVDSKAGMVYFATGQPKDDFYRPGKTGSQLYGNSIIALNANTGKRVWHYQVIHRDLWDLDLPCAPILTDFTYRGKKVPGVVQLTKTGNIFLFNRLTGELLSDVEERPVPPSTLAGESAYPTQPYVKWPQPFSKQVVTEADLTNLSPPAHADALARFRSADTGWYVPPSQKGVIYYGIHGGAEWSGGAYDPTTGMLYVNANELAWHIKMIDINAKEGVAGALQQHPGRRVYLEKGCVGCHGAERQGNGGIPALTSLTSKYKKADVVQIVKNGRGAMPAFSQIPEDEVQALAEFLLNMESQTAVKKENRQPVYRAANYTKFLDKDNYPATAPPWGTLNAINLNTGEIAWKKPLGEYAALTAKGIPPTGTENFGGCIVTKGGLVFIAATRDEKIRAFDKDTGKILWEAQLPFGGYATPSTYTINGKQYVVIAATGGGKLGTKTGDAYVAFTLD
jgi:quinoprotein glucose dehydrogenase